MTAELELVIPGMSTRVDRADASRQRACAVAAARMAAMRTSLVDRRVDAASAARDRGVFGDSLAREELQWLTDELDEEAWGIQARVQRGRAHPDEYRHAFRRARASATWCFALDEDPRRAAVLGIREAHHAVGDSPALVALVDRVLAGELPDA